MVQNCCQSNWYWDKRASLNHLKVGRVWANTFKDENVWHIYFLVFKDWYLDTWLNFFRRHSLSWYQGSCLSSVTTKVWIINKKKKLKLQPRKKIAYHVRISTPIQHLLYFLKLRFSHLWSSNGTMIMREMSTSVCALASTVTSRFFRTWMVFQITTIWRR